MNINMLRDADNDAGFYAAACAANITSIWPGCTVYMSADSGATYTAAFTITAEATMGQTVNALGDFTSGNIRDEINSLNVHMKNGTLSSTTNAGLLAGVNMSIIGDEIICFRDATLESNGTYTLRGLLRGRRGTEYAMSTHVVGDRFLLVDATKFVRVAQSTADIGTTRLYKAVTHATTLAQASPKTFVNLGTGLKPYACVHIGGGRDASNNATIDWVRRTRISGEWRDGVDVPLSEASEAYEVDVYSDDTYATVVRTIAGLTSPTTPYSAADQTSDGLTPGDPIHVSVYQLSAIIGRGHEARGVI